MNLKDRRFGRLVVEGNASRKGYVICLCDCGKRKEIRATSLTKAFQPTRSCGCIQRERACIVGSKTIPQNIAKQVETNMQYHTNFQVIGTHTPPKNNTSGHKGISWDADRKMWVAYINVHNKRVFLGRYAKLDAAVEARKRAEEKYHDPLIAQRDAAEKEGVHDVG